MKRPNFRISHAFECGRRAGAMLVAAFVVIVIVAALSMTLMHGLDLRRVKLHQHQWNMQADLAAAAIETAPVRPDRLELSDRRTVVVHQDRVVVQSRAGQAIAAAAISNISEAVQSPAEETEQESGANQ